MLKKIRFYQGKGGDGQYAIPQELEPLVGITDEAALKERVEAMVTKVMKNDVKKMEQEQSDISNRVLPDFLKDGSMEFLRRSARN